MSNTPRRSPGIIWPMIIVALLFAAGVGYWAYQAGEAHGIEQSAKIIVPPATASAPYPAPYPYPYPYYGWHRPWGFGFFFGPLLFFVFWLVVIRALFWRRRRFFGDGHRGYGYGYGYGGGCDPRSRLDEWHRQAHARDGGTPPEGGVSPA
jgi:hypothetical protein